MALNKVYIDNAGVFSAMKDNEKNMLSNTHVHKQILNLFNKFCKDNGQKVYPLLNNLVLEFLENPELSKAVLHRTVSSITANLK